MSLPLHIPQLETDRLIIRAPGAPDTGAMMSFLGSEHGKFYGGPLDATQAWEKFSAYVGQWVLRGYGMYCVVLKATGETVGMAGPYHPDNFPEPEMSWLLTDARFEGHGYAVEACRAVLNHVFAAFGWKSVVSFIDVGNTPSRKLALRLGAQLDPKTPAAFPNCETYRHFPQGDAQ